MDHATIPQLFRNILSSHLATPLLLQFTNLSFGHVVLIFLSRLSHLWANVVLVADLSKWCVLALALFGPFSPEDLWDVNINNELGQAICSSLGRLVRHGKCSGALAVCDAMKQCAVHEGLVSCKERFHVPNAAKPLPMQVEMVGSVLPVQGVSGTSNALLRGDFESLLCSLQSNAKLI